MEPTHAMTHKCEQHNRSLEKALPTQESCTTQYILRYGLVVRISGSHPGGPGSIPGNGILFSLNIQYNFKTVNSILHFGWQEKIFPRRELNPGLLGESQIS